MSLVLAGSLLAATAADGAAFAARATAACAAPVGTRVGVPGIRVRAKPASAGDLPWFEVTDTRSGSWMRVFHDSASACAARSRADCLGAQIALLDRETGGAWPRARWASVVFTRDAGYVPPDEKGDRRWKIVTPPTAGWTRTASGWSW